VPQADGTACFLSWRRAAADELHRAVSNHNYWDLVRGVFISICEEEVEVVIGKLQNFRGGGRTVTAAVR
jgi:hypothetical protein